MGKRAVMAGLSGLVAAGLGLWGAPAWADSESWSVLEVRVPIERGSGLASRQRRVEGREGRAGVGRPGDRAPV